MPVGVEAWINQIPPVTRGWLVLSIVTSLAVVRGLSLRSLPWRAISSMNYYSLFDCE